MTEIIREYVDVPDLSPSITFRDFPEDDRQTILESEISKFCVGCDHFQEGKPCFVGSNDQARYAARKWCGWAKTAGQRAIKQG
jgi:hypothetical protein